MSLLTELKNLSEFMPINIASLQDQRSLGFIKFKDPPKYGLKPRVTELTFI
jgi:hypothetical protein